MRPTKTILDRKALDIIKIGVNAIYEPVRRTLGPLCRTTLMYRSFNRGPRDVDDGYYTADVIEPRDPAIKLASDFFKEGIKRTNEKVGDGTSTTGVIAGKLFNDCYNLLTSQNSGFSLSNAVSPMKLKRSILDEAKKVKEEILKVTKPIKSLDELEKIAIISLGGDEELAKKIAKTAWELGENFSIDVVEGYGGQVEIDTFRGMKFPAKLGANAFITKPERFEMVVEDAPIIITNYKLDNANQVAHIIKVVASPKIILVAPDFSETVLIEMVHARKSGMFIYPVKTPSLRTEQYEDLAIYCGAKFIDKHKGNKLEHVVQSDSGFVEKIIVKGTEVKEDAEIHGGKGSKTSAVKEHIRVLEGQRDKEHRDQFKKLLTRRIASMDSAIGTIRVGSPTDAETLPLKLKIEDVVYACKSAMRGGYVEGGGLCLKKIANKLDKDNILRGALIAPYNQIQENAGEEIKITKDIIDPSEAIYYAVEHATSVVGSLVTVGSIIPEMSDPIHGEGEFAIAQAMTKIDLTLRRHYGIIKENEEEVEKDNLNSLTNGLTIDEFSQQDSG